MRMLRLMVGDIRFQMKYGFYFLYLIFSLVYLILLMILPQEWQLNAGVLMIYSDPAALGLFFMGAIILLEKSQGVLNALAISPVSNFDYIGAKVLSLCMISVIVSLVLTLATGCRPIITVMVTTALTSIIFSLLGIIVGTKITSLNQYMVATIPLEIICFIPPLIYLFKPMKELRWHPLTRAIALLSNDSESLFGDFLLLIIFAGLLYLIAYQSTSKMWRTLGGAKL